METTLTLAELRHHGVELQPHEAVAVAQALMCCPGGASGAQAPFGPPSLETVAIGADGRVCCQATAATPAVAEVAILLDALLGGSAARVPGGLRYTVGRALHEVEAPPFDSIEEFSTALERFERGERIDVIAGLHRRAVAAQAASAPAGGRGAVDGDRRQHGPAVADLRRELRDADLRLYEAHQAARGASATSPRAPSRLRGPIPACMVAGVAMVAFGEFPQVRQALATTAAPAQSDTASRVPIAPTASVSGPAVLPASGRGLVNDRPQGSRVVPVSRATSTAVQHPGRTGTSAVRRAASRVEPHDTKTPRTRRTQEHDPDRGVIARIRFEWTNPFK